jgi:hypothetical protein
VNTLQGHDNSLGLFDHGLVRNKYGGHKRAREE